MPRCALASSFPAPSQAKKAGLHAYGASAPALRSTALVACGEQGLLLQVFQPLAERVPGPLHLELQQVNGELWEVEEAIRACDRRGDFGGSFVELARRVYRLNDRRAALKRAINLASGSDLVEEKSYANLPLAPFSP